MIVPEHMLQALIAHHENAFAHVAMAQAKLLQGGDADLSVLDAMTSRMAHHAAVLAELRR